MSEFDRKSYQELSPTDPMPEPRSSSNLGAPRTTSAAAEKPPSPSELHEQIERILVPIPYGKVTAAAELVRKARTLFERFKTLPDPGGTKTREYTVRSQCLLLRTCRKVEDAQAEVESILRSKCFDSSPGGDCRLVAATISRLAKQHLDAQEEPDLDEYLGFLKLCDLLPLRGTEEVDEIFRWSYTEFLVCWRYEGLDQEIMQQLKATSPRCCAWLLWRQAVGALNQGDKQTAEDLCREAETVGLNFSGRQEILGPMRESILAWPLPAGDKNIEPASKTGEMSCSAQLSSARIKSARIEMQTRGGTLVIDPVKKLLTGASPNQSKSLASIRKVRYCLKKPPRESSNFHECTLRLCLDGDESDVELREEVALSKWNDRDSDIRDEIDVAAHWVAVLLNVPLHKVTDTF